MLIISQDQNTIIESTGVTLFAGDGQYKYGKHFIRAETVNYSYTIAHYDSESEAIGHLRSFIEAYENGDKVFRFEL